jgi:hypothetical protein
VSWLTDTDTAAFLETVPDAQLTAYTAAVRGEVERIRSDLDFTQAVPAQVLVGSMLWVKALTQARMAPSGFPAYDDPSDVYGPVSSSRWVEISRLIGLRRPVVA